MKKTQKSVDKNQGANIYAVRRIKQREGGTKNF